MINFALDILGTRVTSDKVSTDGYECTNLISKNYQLQGKGYMAEHFIKPPVNVTFSFPCNINVYQIILNPCVSQQQSTQLEVYSASNTLPKPFVKRGKVDNLSCSTHGSQIPGMDSNFNISTSDSVPIFFPISKICLSTSSRVCFYNPDPHLDRIRSSLPLSTSYKNSAMLRHSRWELLTRVSHISLRITGTLRASTPCMSQVEIWAKPSSDTPALVKSEIMNKYLNSFKQCVPNQGGMSQKRKTIENEHSNSHSSDPPSEDIPEDFLDPITCEVMASPLLLPSGKNVDKYTLDRYINIEASNGRKPRDPFTGVEFSDSYKPLPNAALKFRIDRFLMTHTEDISSASISRSTGTIKHCTLVGKHEVQQEEKPEGISTLVHPKRRKVDLDKSPIVLSQSVTTEHRRDGAKRTGVSTSCGSKSVAHDESERSYSQMSSSKELSHSCTGAVFTADDSTHVHESLVKNSLNNALSSVLAGLPSYTSSCSEEQDTKCDSCAVCKIFLDESIVIYKTPCNHNVCRNCVTKYTEQLVVCPVCNQEYKKADVVRMHKCV